MRVKTYLATYLLFLCVLFGSVGIVSAYMTGSQMDMLREKSAREYQAIADSLARDIAGIYGRFGGPGADFRDAVDTLVRGYMRYYERHNVHIEVTDLSLLNADSYTDAELAFEYSTDGRFIHITGTLPEPFEFYRLEYRLNITENIADMQNILNILMLSAVAFSIVAAIALYFILSGIFKPLSLVAKASRKIAGGQYGERIQVGGKHEIASMALDFNCMADEIETQIELLADEAASKQQFADNFAHEIRTPLTSIYGYAEYMQKAVLSEEEIIDSAQYIMDEADHMKRLADAILELATLRNYTPDKTEIPISELFEDVAQTMKKPLTEHNAWLEYRSDVDTLEAERDLIKSLLLNLCSNALKSCFPGKGIIRLTAKRKGDKVIISVSDNGCGISDENMNRLFEPFYRVDKSRSREHGGVGLGLALCRQIAHVHGAQMTIGSVEGAGTTVKITFTAP